MTYNINGRLALWLQYTLSLTLCLGDGVKINTIWVTLVLTFKTLARLWYYWMLDLWRKPGDKVNQMQPLKCSRMIKIKLHHVETSFELVVWCTFFIKRLDRQSTNVLNTQISAYFLPFFNSEKKHFQNWKRTCLTNNKTKSDTQRSEMQCKTKLVSVLRLGSSMTPRLTFGRFCLHCGCLVDNKWRCIV